MTVSSHLNIEGQSGEVRTIRVALGKRGGGSPHGAVHKGLKPSVTAALTSTGIYSAHPPELKSPLLGETLIGQEMGGNLQKRYFSPSPIGESPLHPGKRLTQQINQNPAEVLTSHSKDTRVELPFKGHCSPLCEFRIIHLPAENSDKICSQLSERSAHRRGRPFCKKGIILAPN